MNSILSLYVVLGLVAYASAHAGLAYPAPAGPQCNGTTPLANCGLEVDPCGGYTVTSYSPIILGPYGLDSVELQIYQRVSHYNTENYYQISYFSPLTQNFQVLDTFFQGIAVNETGEALITLRISTPFSTIQNLKTSVQMIFNATAGGGSIYYSCAGIWINPPCPDISECSNEGEQCAAPANDGSMFQVCNPANTYCNGSSCLAIAAGVSCFGICDIPQLTGNPQDVFFGTPSFFCNMSAGFPGVCEATTVSTVGEYCDNAAFVCAMGSYCNNNNCTVYQAYGENCTAPLECAPSLVCGFNGTCDVLFSQPLGGPCQDEGYCMPGLTCNVTSQSGEWGVCITPASGEAGQDCQYTAGVSNCSFGYSCACTGYNTDTEKCMLETTFNSNCQTEITTYQTCMTDASPHSWNDCIQEGYCVYRCIDTESQSAFAWANPKARCYTQTKCAVSTTGTTGVHTTTGSMTTTGRAATTGVHTTTGSMTTTGRTASTTGVHTTTEAVSTTTEAVSTTGSASTPAVAVALLVSAIAMVLAF